MQRAHPDDVSPPPDIDVCPTCFLFQARGGRRCPPAQISYDLEVMRAAVRADASSVTTFADLVRQDAGTVCTKPTFALMPGAPETLANDTEKEVSYVDAPSSAR
jgi:hypothetical protein